MEADGRVMFGLYGGDRSGGQKLLREERAGGWYGDVAREWSSVMSLWVYKEDDDEQERSQKSFLCTANGQVRR